MNNISHFDKFTERAKKVIDLAQEEARHFQHASLGTEHLLLGLLGTGGSTVAYLLEDLTITPEKVRKAIEETKGRGNNVIQGEMGLTPNANTVIEMALKAAERQFPPRSTGTEPRLIGSIQMPESEAEKILQEAKLPQDLESMGVTLEEVRKAVEAAKGRGVQILIDQTSEANTPTEEAERRRHPFFSVDTGEIFLGLLRVPESTGMKILQDLGLPSRSDVHTLMYLEHGTTPITTREYTQKFTKQARKAWKLAHEESHRLQDSFIGAHHLLLGLVGEGSGIAATVLAKMGVDLDKMREKVKPGYEADDWGTPENIKMQPHLKYIIELASNEARRLYHPSINTGHLLLAIIREDRGIEEGLLSSLGVDLDNLRPTLRRVLRDGAGLSEQEADETGEEWSYAPHASIESIEKDLLSRELDKTILAVYPLSLEVRDVLEGARIGPRNLNQRFGPEHLLLGLSHLTFDDVGPVSKALKDVGIDFAKTQAALENRVGQGEPSVVLVQTALCKAYLLLAVTEAEQRDGPGAQIKNEHLLLALLREEKGIIADLLGDLGTTIETVRTKLLEAMKDLNPKGLHGT